ncbi:MAG TPA: hypothetical protein VF518_05220 [Polyangia bacterium]
MSTLCFLSLLLATAAPGVDKTVWLLEQNDWQREEAALLEALLMYTRDLRVPITISLTPAEAEAAEGETVAESIESQVETARTRCAAGAWLVLWFDGRRTEPSLSVYRCAEAAELKMPLVPVDDLDLAAQTLALKLRGVIAQLPEAADRSAGHGRKAADSSLHTKAEREVSAWELGLGYALLAASADSGLRQGGTLRLGKPFVRWPIAVEVDATLATSLSYGAKGYQVSASDLPLGLALTVRSGLTGWLFAAGPRVSLHYVKATGSGPDGRKGNDSSTSAGLGGIAQMRYQALKRLAFGLALMSEVVMPRQRFTLDKGYPLDVGMWQWALTAGVVYSFY